MDRPSVSLFKPFSLLFVFPSHWPNVTHLRSRPFGFYLFFFLSRAYTYSQDSLFVMEETEPACFRFYRSNISQKKTFD